MEHSVFLKGVNQKKEKAWEKLYHYYYASLCSYAEKLTGDAEVAEDIVQECLIRMWHTPSEFPELKALTAWLYKSVYHASISALRKKRSQERLSEAWHESEACDEQGALKMALKEEAISRFYDILYQMPQQQQDILLYSLKGLKVQEIAGILTISENTVKTQKKRAYLFVREHFDPAMLQVLLTFFWKK